MQDDRMIRHIRHPKSGFLADVIAAIVSDNRGCEHSNEITATQTRAVNGKMSNLRWNWDKTPNVFIFMGNMSNHRSLGTVYWCQWLTVFTKWWSNICDHWGANRSCTMFKLRLGKRSDYIKDPSLSCITMISVTIININTKQSRQWEIISEVVTQ